MGIPMNRDGNLHAPTVACGPASGGAAADFSRSSLPALMQEKERIERELSALSSILSSVSAAQLITSRASGVALLTYLFSMGSTWIHR